MRRIKTITSIILIISVLAVCLCVKASALVIYDGDFGFEVNASKREAVLVKYTGNAETVQLPAYFQDYPVTVIDKNAFFENKKIKEIVFSNTNTTVEEYAFMGCTALETVYIPENVVSFGDRVFANCTSLKTVTLLSDMSSVPTNMFSGCSSLENLTINQNIAGFDYGCFNGCSSLTDLDFVADGAMIDSYAFNGTGAASVTLSDSLIAIPDYAFTNCKNLKYVTVPESVIMIQPNAFDWHNVTIRCFENSAAHVFAVEHNLSYEIVNRVMIGDTLSDGCIDISDVTAIQRHLANLETFNELSLLAADTNQDGIVDISDATAIQMFLAKYDVPFAIGETVIK